MRLRREANSYVELLQRSSKAKDLELGRRLHTELVEDGHEQNTTVANLLVQMYGKCRCIEGARFAFDRIAKKDAFSWNMIIAAHAQNGQLREAREVFERSPRKEVSAWNTMITAYAKGGNLHEAKKLFDVMQVRNEITCNVMLGAFAQGGQMVEARMMFDSLPHPNILNWTNMITGYAKVGQLCEAKSLYDIVPVKDTVAQTAMMAAYVKNGQLLDARKMFEDALQHDLVAWNIMISAYAHSAQKTEAVFLFRRMDLESVFPDKRSFTRVLYACEELQLCRCIHKEAIEAGIEVDGALATALFIMYGRCGDVDTMRHMFDAVPVKDVVPWTAMITAFGRKGHVEDARRVFDIMPQRNLVTWTAMLTAHADSGHLQSAVDMLHEMPHRDVVSTTAVMAAYARNGYVDDARRMFEETRDRDVVLWTAMISAYASNGLDAAAIELFRVMDLEGMRANKTTFLAILDACSNLADLSLGKIVHQEVIQSGLAMDIMVRSCVVNMYGKCGSSECAKEAFEKIPEPDAVLCNAMLAAYAQNGHLQEAKHLFDSMPKKTSASWNSMFTAYAQGAYMVEARELFEKIYNKDVVAWSGMVAAYIKSGEFRKAFHVFLEMDVEGVQPNKITFISVCDACGNLSNMTLARLVHEEVATSAWREDALLWDSVVAMYGRCGNLVASKELFDNMLRRDAEAWNSLLGSHSHSGDAARVLDLFKWMLVEGCTPNKNTFVVLFAACSHTGLAQDGLAIFHAMVGDHGIQANAEHFTCMVDILARAGRLRDAEDLISAMPFQPEALTWTSLLGGYRESTEAERGGKAAVSVFDLEPSNAAPYMLLSNLYRSAEVNNVKTC